MAYVNLSKMPSPNREYSVGFDTLAGGLNLQELDYRISNNESPEMKNLMWREGVLSCRDGQVWVGDTPVELGTFHASYERLWRGFMFAHIDNKIYKVDPETAEAEVLYTATEDRAPIIVINPTSKTVNLNGNVRFGVVASGDGLSYQWQYMNSDDTDWHDSNATGNRTNVISFTGVAAANGRKYRCKVTNEYGSAYSSAATTTVIIPENASTGRGGDPEGGLLTGPLRDEEPVPVQIPMSVKGKFFPYNEKLYYKTEGFYIVIEYDPDSETFTAHDVGGYIPVTYINCTPVNGSGTIYQPENRLSEYKTLWYNSAFTLTVSASTGLSASIESSYFRMRINTPGTYTFTYNGSNWQLNGENVDPLDYGITVGGTPTNGSTLTVVYKFVNEYYLPISVDSVDQITVDGFEQAQESIAIEANATYIHPEVDIAVWRTVANTTDEYDFIYDYNNTTWKLNGSPVDPATYGITYTIDTGEYLVNNDQITVTYIRGDYWLDAEAGKITFFVAPKVTYPETNNTVHVTYSKENELAYNNIMDCRYVEVYGGTGALCIVLAGCSTQPNAYFWNGQTSISMDASYFPMTQYQLAGDGVDPITGFGKQQGYLIIFKNRSIGRTSLTTATVEGRTTIDLPYVAINAKIGCDLPYTIQLIENNLVWCNTDRGVHFLANTSAAYENNVADLSDKINESGASWNAGLLYDVRKVDSDLVVSHDDEKHYWLVVDGHVWMWDYYISNYKNPSWFFFDNVNGLGFVQELSDVWHFDIKGRLTHFERVYFDYDPSSTGKGAIDKILRFATQYFGTYDNYKTVNSVVINTRSDTDSILDLTYMTDYEVRKDLTPLVSIAWRLVPRNLERRNLEGSGFAKVFRRKAHCRRIQYFTMKLENKTPGMDMSIVSAQIFYVYQGRQR